jgi:hypothetical protein
MMPALTSSAGDLLGGSPRRLSGPVECLISGFLGSGTRFTFRAELLNLIICEVLDSHETIARRAHANEFVQLYLNGGAVPVLRILNQKYHKESYDGGPSINDQLPSVRELEERAAYAPYYHHTRG